MGDYIIAILSFIYTDRFLNILTLIISTVNIYVAYRVYQFTKRDVNPKLYVDSKILNSDETLNTSIGRFINEDLINENFDRKRFPEIQHDTMLWQLKIVNNGEHPATNVVVEYSIIIKRAIFDQGEDELDIKNERFVDYKILNKNVNFDYIPPGSEKNHDIFLLRGEFSKADLIVKKLVSDEIEFITQQINLDNYEHPDLNNLEDGNHGRKMLGVYLED